MIDGIISALADAAAPLKLYAISTHSFSDCVIYQSYTSESDAISERVRLEVTIITSDDAGGRAVEKRIKDALLTFGDEPFSSDVLRVVLDGGGTLEDTARGKIHRQMYFTILARYDGR